MNNDPLPRIDLRLLRQFVAVAEELHFRRAADRLGMSQPPLTAAIRRLEQEVGASLIERGRKTVRLTPAGAVLLDEARRLLAAANDALAATSDADVRVELREMTTADEGLAGQTGEVGAASNPHPPLLFQARRMSARLLA